MGNPRKRKAIKDGRMQQMVEQVQNSQTTVEKEELLFDEPAVKSENVAKEKAIDPFIAKELEEIKRIPSSKKKVTKKKTTTKKTTTKKTTAKNKTGGK